MFFYMDDLHLDLPAIKVSTLDAGSKTDDVLTEHGRLLHDLPLAVHLNCVLTEKYPLLTNLSKLHSLSFLQDPSFMLKSLWSGRVGRVVASIIDWIGVGCRGFAH